MSVDGTWQLSVQTPIGEHKPVLVLSTKAGTLTGSLTMPGSETLSISEGALSGTTTTWKSEVKVPFPMTLGFEVQIDGDALTGTCKPPMMPASKVTGVRVLASTK